jgi:hypothetical protein
MRFLVVVSIIACRSLRLVGLILCLSTTSARADEPGPPETRPNEPGPPIRTEEPSPTRPVEVRSGVDDDNIVYIRTNNTEGSGVLINEEGYIVTARHVVGKGNDVKVSLRSRNAYPVPAQVSDCLGDNVRDFCVIKINPSDVRHESINHFPRLSCNKVGINVKISVKGYPQGDNNDIQNIPGEETISGVGEQFTQPTTTPIAKGLSGAAVVASGELVGVMVGVPDDSSQSYFMPLEQVETHLPHGACNKILPPREDLTDAQFCNYSAGPVNLVTIGRLQEDNFVLRGWTTLRPGVCHTVETFVRNSPFYWYAEQSSPFARNWPPDVGRGPFCLGTGDSYIKGFERVGSWEELKNIACPGNWKRVFNKVAPRATERVHKISIYQ